MVFSRWIQALSVVSSVWVGWDPAVILQLYSSCWPGVGRELSDPVRKLVMLF